MRIGDKVYAMADNSSIEGECVVIKGRTFDDDLTSVTGDEIDDEGQITVRWCDDQTVNVINGWLWSFVPAERDNHDEYSA